MADEYIKRSNAINALKGLPTWWADQGGIYGNAQPPMAAMLDPEDAVSAIENIPSADVVGVKRGEWLPNKYIYDALDCSICGHFVYDDDIPNFCPNCGADMRNEGEW